jgi:autotransporter-associated beta strand protein
LLDPAAHAQTDYYWNVPNGGDGTWDTGSADWSASSGGSLNYTWTNSGSERANFGGNLTAGANVSIAAAGILAYGLNFNTTGAGTYTLSGGPLTLTGAGGEIAVTTSALINSIIGGSVGLTKLGTGTLTLTGANIYTGVTTVTSGELLVSNTTGSATGSGGVNVTGTGTVGSGGTLGGTGFITGNVTISRTRPGSQGGTIAPGTPAAIGTLTLTNSILTFNPQGSYAFKYNGAATSPRAGVDNDTIADPTGTLDLSNLNPVNRRFTVMLVATPGATVGTPVTYTAGSFGSIILPAGVTGPDVTALFAFTGNFSGPANATITGNQLQFTFTPAPEPAHLLLVCGAVAGAGWSLARLRGRVGPGVG